VRFSERWPHLSPVFEEEASEASHLVTGEVPDTICELFDVSVLAALALEWILSSPCGEDVNEAPSAAIRLAPDDSAEPLNGLTGLSRPGNHDREVGSGHIDSLVEDPGRAQRLRMTMAEAAESPAPGLRRRVAADRLTLDPCRTEDSAGLS